MFSSVNWEPLLPWGFLAPPPARARRERSDPASHVVNSAPHHPMSTPPFHTLPPPDADPAFHEAFPEWELRSAAVVGVALVCAETWREGNTPIAEILDRLCVVTRAYEEADAALRVLDQALRKRPRSPGAP